MNNNGVPIAEEYKAPVFDTEDTLLEKVEQVTCVCGCVKC